jgi:hypothetical protein
VCTRLHKRRVAGVADTDFSSLLLADGMHGCRLKGGTFGVVPLAALKQPDYITGFGTKSISSCEAKRLRIAVYLRECRAERASSMLALRPLRRVDS